MPAASPAAAPAADHNTRGGGETPPASAGRRPAFLLLCLLAFPALAQDAVVAGVVGDSSIVAPVISWQHGERLNVSLNGWTMAGELKLRRAVASLSITPVNAYAGDRIYVDGDRADGREFDASSIEATFGRIDKIGKRWISDIRIVALHDSFDDRTNSYVGIRMRQAWRHITAEDPLLRTFEGLELSAATDLFAGDETWGRIRLDQRFSKRWGRLRAGESVFALHGHDLDFAHAFLLGGYGYRYAEFRVDRGVGADVDFGFAITPSIELGAHAGGMKARDLETRGVAVDVTALVRGIGVRLGIGKAEDRDEVVVYGSIVAARFVR
jgi:hypothetical protein